MGNKAKIYVAVATLRNRPTAVKDLLLRLRMTMRGNEEFVLGFSHNKFAHVDYNLAAIFVVQLRLDEPFAPGNEQELLRVLPE